jgi:hypothetical protein
MSPKIEANYRRNYHDGETSPVNSVLFYMYFSGDKLKKWFSRVLYAAYRNPYSEKRNSLI